MKKDSLISGFLRAKLSGSIKTQVNDRQAIKRFVETLRQSGCNIEKWKNIHCGHVSSVVEAWKNDVISAGTIKNYLSSVRKICSYYDNIKISSSKNSQFDIENRSYISNKDKSVDNHTYTNAISTLENGNINQQAVGLIMQIARTFGTRLEESYKFSPKKDVLNNTVTISRGTKGGRERTFEMNSKQQMLSERVKSFVGKKDNLIPAGWTEKSWRQYVYREARNAGISTARCGASFHGLRHARFHELYEKTCGFKPRIKFRTTSEFINAATSIAGEDWKKLDAHASRIVTLQAGHGVDRYVYTQYLGSWRSK